jgi:hypothetical protein
MVTSAICSSCSFGMAIGTERQRPVNKSLCCSCVFIWRSRLYLRDEINCSSERSTRPVSTIA